LGRVIGCTQWRSTGLVLLVLHALALHALAMAPAQAGAQTEDGEIERWRERHEAASAALRADDFARAEALEREALAIRPAPQSAFNLGLALRGQRRMREAADTFDRMLRGEWGPLPRARTEQATLLRDETRRALGRLRVSARASAPVLVQVDGVRAGEIRAADPPLEAAIDPGAHVVIASASRHTAIERTVEVASGATVSLDLVLTPESDGEIPREGERALQLEGSEQARESDDEAMWWVVAGVSVAVVAAAAITAGFLLQTEGPVGDPEGRLPIVMTR
jgi:hypothetical protein